MNTFFDTVDASSDARSATAAAVGATDRLPRVCFFSAAGDGDCLYFLGGDEARFVRFGEVAFLAGGESETLAFLFLAGDGLAVFAALLFRPGDFDRPRLLGAAGLPLRPGDLDLARLTDLFRAPLAGDFEAFLNKNKTHSFSNL